MNKTAESTQPVPAANDTAAGTAASATRGTPLEPAMLSAAAWLRFLLVAIGGLIADLWSKHAAFAFLGYGPGSKIHVVIPHVLTLETTLNNGAVFGIGQGLAVLFILISLVAMAFVVYVFMSSLRRQWIIHVALGLILAGAMGNLYDRLFNHGRVRDFILLTHWPFDFNLADTMLCIGVPLLIINWLFQLRAVQK